MTTSAPIVGVAGLGAMGLGIAQVFAQSGFRVLATDASPEPRDNARSRFKSALSLRVEAGKLTSADAAETLDRLTIAPEIAGLAPASLIVEAIVERLDAKRALFAALEPQVAIDAILATNTSSLSVNDIAQGLTRPSRVIGLHFFNPAPAMRLVELVAHQGSDPGALATARMIVEATGKTVVSCPDRPGFIVNRCARPFYGEALAMLQEGSTPHDIDAAMLQAGYRLGPFALIDLIGADVHLAATEGMSAAMNRHPRYHVFAALRAQVAKGDLGRKSGHGFVFPDSPGTPPADAADIAARIEATLVNEAASLLAEGGVAARDIDTAMKLGMNFPRGPFEILRTRGPKEILALLQDLESRAPPELRGRYVPSPALTEA